MAPLGGQNEVYTGGTCLLGKTRNQLLHLLADDHHHVGQLVDDHDDKRQRRQGGVLNRLLLVHQRIAEFLRAGVDARHLGESEHYDLVVLDLGLPGRPGLEVLANWRARGNRVPVLILTARGQESDRVRGLELGADDYVVKPFSPRELVARVRALLRRVDGGEAGSETIRAADVEIDVPKMRVTVGDRTIDLTPTEFEILKTLAASPGRIFTRGQLLDVLHGISFESYERAIDAHIKNLRRKLADAGASEDLVETVFGVGYRLAAGGGA